MFVPYNAYHDKKSSSKKSKMSRTSRYALMKLLQSRKKKLPPHPTKSNLYNSAVRSHFKIPMMNEDEEVLCAKRYPELSKFSKEMLVAYLKSKNVNTTGMAKIDACHKITVTDELSLDDVLRFVNGEDASANDDNKRGVKGRKSNRPKSRKSCMKRNMKWNSATKRCNKKSLKK